MRDEEGNPIAGVEVSAYKFYRRGESFGAWIDTVYLAPVVKLNPSITDADGRYRLTGVLLDARVVLSINKPGYAVHQYWRGYDSNNVVMVPGGSIAGQMVDELGKAVAGKLVQAYGRGGDNSWSQGFARTDRNGLYRIGGLIPGEHVLICFRVAEGKFVRSPEAPVLVETDRTTQAPELVMRDAQRHGVPVYGRVMDKDTRAFCVASLRLTPRVARKSTVGKHRVHQLLEGQRRQLRTSCLVDQARQIGCRLSLGKIARQAIARLLP